MDVAIVATGSLATPHFSPGEHAAVAWAAMLVHALTLDEAAGRRPLGLTEADLATWKRFRGRLAPNDFLAKRTGAEGEG